MIVQSKLAEHSLVQKLAAFTKIPRTEFVRAPLYSMETREELPIVDYPILVERFGGSLNPLFYCVTVAGKGALNILHLLDPVKWLKSPIREAFVQGAGYLSSQWFKSRYVLVTYLTGMTWVTTAHDWKSLPGGANFGGGILLQDPEDARLFVTRPIKNYLIENLGQLQVGG